MKKYIFITTLMLICSFSRAFAVSPKGFYLSPKFIFSHDANNIYLKEDGKRGYYNYLGASLALGYGIATENTVSPVRLEFEYSIGKAIGMKTNFLSHTLLGTVYYDINFFFTDLALDDDTRKEILKSQYPLFSIFLGFSIGSKINTHLDGSSINENKLNIARTSIVFGATAGFSFNMSSWAAFDICYRFIIDVTPRWYHEALAGVRFTIPRY